MHKYISETATNITAIILGLITIVILLGIISMILSKIIQTWKSRRWNNQEYYLKVYIGQINDYCEYEFPQVSYTVKNILTMLNKKPSLSADQFRQNMRNKEPERLHNEKFNKLKS